MKSIRFPIKNSRHFIWTVSKTDQLKLTCTVFRRKSRQVKIWTQLWRVNDWKARFTGSILNGQNEVPGILYWKANRLHFHQSRRSIDFAQTDQTQMPGPILNHIESPPFFLRG